MPLNGTIHVHHGLRNHSETSLDSITPTFCQSFGNEETVFFSTSAIHLNPLFILHGKILNYHWYCRPHPYNEHPDTDHRDLETQGRVAKCIFHVTWQMHVNHSLLPSMISVPTGTYQ